MACCLVAGFIGVVSLHGSLHCAAVSVSITEVAVGQVPRAGTLAAVAEFTEGGDQSASAVTLPTKALGVIGAGLSVSESFLSMLAADTSRGAQDRIFIGDGLPTVPKRVYNRMVAWEFVDLAELRPQGAFEVLQQESDQQKLLVLPAHGFQVSKAKRKPIKELNTWIQCFAVYIGVMAGKHPSAVPEMLAYMLTIMKAAREYEDPTWILYDLAYRDKAAATKNRTWSQIDVGLYNQIFTGRARQLKLCKHCNSTSHATDEYTEASRKTPAEENAGGSRPAKVTKSDVCFLFNKGRCTFQMCKFRHMCSICSGRHAAISCPRKVEKGSGSAQGSGGSGPSPRS